MNPIDIFALTVVAHSDLAPLMKPLNANLQIVLDFDIKFPGVQVWVFNNTNNHALAHRSRIMAREQLDDFVTEVRALASAAA